MEVIHVCWNVNILKDMPNVFLGSDCIPDTIIMASIRSASLDWYNVCAGVPLTGGGGGWRDSRMPKTTPFLSPTTNNKYIM